MQILFIMKTFIISVDSYGFYASYVIDAKDIYSAKRKAKRMAIKEFISDMKCFKTDWKYPNNYSK